MKQELKPSDSVPLTIIEASDWPLHLASCGRAGFREEEKMIWPSLYCNGEAGGAPAPILYLQIPPIWSFKESEQLVCPAVTRWREAGRGGNEL